MKKLVIALLLALAVIGFFLLRDEIPSSDDLSSAARDPGVRGGAAGAGAPIAGLTNTELAFFNAGKDEFAQEEEVADGLGPTMNLDGCGGCHLQPAVGGTSPAVNPQVAFATLNGATNTVPSFITPRGPVRGPGLADGVTQGQAGPREFRTAPLWGLGQRLFFLHDGRTSDLREAIRVHRSGSFLTFNASEANAVVRNFNRLQDDQKQDVLNFLRSL